MVYPYISKVMQESIERGLYFLKKQLLVYTVLGVLGGAVLYLFSGGKVYPFDRTAPGYGFRAAGGGDE